MAIMSADLVPPLSTYSFALAGSCDAAITSFFDSCLTTGDRGSPSPSNLRKSRLTSANLPQMRYLKASFTAFCSGSPRFCARSSIAAFQFFLSLSGSWWWCWRALISVTGRFALRRRFSLSSPLIICDLRSLLRLRASCSLVKLLEVTSEVKLVV